MKINSNTIYDDPESINPNNGKNNKTGPKNALPQTHH